MNEAELIKFLQENLTIKINWIDSYDVSVSLLLNNEVISESSVNTGFAEKYHNHNGSEYD